MPLSRPFLLLATSSLAAASPVLALQSSDPTGSALENAAQGAQDVADEATAAVEAAIEAVQDEVAGPDAAVDGFQGPGQPDDTPELPNAFPPVAPQGTELPVAAPAEAEAEAAATPPREADDLMDAITGGRSWINFRYRYEAAEVRGFPDRSWASTLRTALGHETLRYRGFRALGEIEAIGHIFNPAFNDTTGSNANRAPVPDPETVEINQLYVAYDGFEGLDARLGRQEIELGNQRFVGSDPWRQNNQSFDALRLGYEVDDTLSIDYSFAFQVNRVTGRDGFRGNEDMAAHFLDVRKSVDGIGDFAAYAFLLDFDESNTLSSNTLGLRYQRAWKGSEMPGKDAFWNRADWDLTLEYAKQSDAGDNPNDVDADYLLVEGAAEFAGYRVFLANEMLGGSGNQGDRFTTPLASLHWFNGFADQFQNTPDAGLIDRRLGVETDVRISRLPFPVSLSATYHLFCSDAASIDYGREFDFDVFARVNDHFSLGARYADFNGDEVFRNANRAMIWAAYRVL